MTITNIPSKNAGVVFISHNGVHRWMTSDGKKVSRAYPSLDAARKSIKN